MPRKGKNAAAAGYDDYDDGFDDYEYYHEDDYEDYRGPANTAERQASLQNGNLWRCSICTYDNPEDLASCDICGALRRPPSTSCSEAGDKSESFGEPSVLAKSLFAPLPPVKLKKRSVLQQVKASLVGNGLDKVLGTFENTRSKNPIVPFKFDTPSPDDLVLAGKQAPIKSSAAKASTETSKLPAVIKQKERLPLKEKERSNPVQNGMPRGSSKIAQNDSNPSDMEVQVVERLKAVDLHSNKEAPSKKYGRPLDAYQPEGWILKAFNEERKQLLHLAIVGHVDAGKSTLMGRLLHALGEVSQKDMHKYEKEAKQQGKGSFSYAWVLDEGTEERARGVTMTVAVAQFETPKFHIVVLDSPGHKDFVPNMISGASQADAAVLVVDASMGAFEAGMIGGQGGVGQTREHTQLVRSFGVEQIVVAVNKIDVVNYSEDRFNNIKATLRPFLRQCGFKESGIRWVPLSAMENENLVAMPSKSELKSWYSGPNLLEAIDTFEPPVRSVAKPFRLPIADTMKSRTLGQAAVSGKIEGGAIMVGSTVLVMPSGLEASVKGIEQNGKPCSVARAGENVNIGLQGIDPACLIQGGVLCHSDYPVPIASRLELKVLVLETTGPLLRGSQVVLYCHHAKEPAKITELVSLLDQKGEAIPSKKPRCLLANQRAIIEVVPERGICVEEYSRYKALGRITLREGGKTLALGVVMRILDFG